LVSFFLGFLFLQKKEPKYINEGTLAKKIMWKLKYINEDYFDLGYAFTNLSMEK
jgi:hypothetical protein